jgi:hypothetical protein
MATFQPKRRVFVAAQISLLEKLDDSLTKFIYFPSLNRDIINNIGLAATVGLF